MTWATATDNITSGSGSFITPNSTTTTTTATT
eukprot:CAMPEP_0175057252 /NCGR_PEP_ID=MMETSP0052_2-20121109/11156_1 /TAXON_ID=51329 ORGANISM="Polytomella parva, Strain SAG 63-3" /NCGR_SAMPLE_ID=MMETSP0052_2 /ASSEMBLY_ACC=CAM_ASM_000194 /LENGTH=31 /DNA_ID= /DNA_START= /DNA_END= /DNA_ORIENTATION=